MKSQTWLQGLQALEATHRKRLHTEKMPADIEHPLHTLSLAQSLLMKQVIYPDQADPAKHLAVIGPTQAGKSTLINAILKSECAKPSPLAGFTRHAEGFGGKASLAEPEIGALTAYFAPAIRLMSEQQDRDNAAECWSISAVTTNVMADMPNLMVWDTPDFDSLDAASYRTGLLKVIALADLCLLVLSKEKYADQSVWQLLRLIQPLGIPTLVCINKVPDGYETMLRESFAARWGQIRSDRIPTLITLPYAHEGLKNHASTERMRMLISRELAQPDHGIDRSAAFIRFRDAQWASWLAPLYEDERIQLQWQQKLHQQSDSFLDRYDTIYLQHPLHYVSFQLAMAEMLRLLEIPGIGRPLNQLRRLTLWPAKKLQQWLGSDREPPEDSEVMLLRQLAQNLLMGLIEDLGHLEERCQDTHVWLKLQKRLRNQQTELMNGFAESVQDYHVAFQEDIDRTAQQLFNRLQQHPALLNSLRATRAATDAAALAIALHTGGIGIQDFLLAPASLGITSMLTESVLGQYMHHAAYQLKQRQKQAVNHLLGHHLMIPLQFWLEPSCCHEDGHPLNSDWFESLRQQDLA